MATEGLVDAHVHVASSDVERYPRHPTGVGTAWWRNGGDAAELVATLDASGVSRAVVVQAVGVYGYDCRYAGDVVAEGGDRFAFVGAVDMAGPDVVGAVADLGRNSALAGLRVFGVGEADAAWLSNGKGRNVWGYAAETGCVLVPTIFTEGLAALGSLIEAQPEVTVALDHCAFPDLGGPGALADLLRLAELPALHLKVTSHNLDSGADPAAFLEPLVEAFGSDRLCWGSDHPQHDSRTYREMLDLARHAARNLTRTERDAFLGGNGLRLWWPPS